MVELEQAWRDPRTRAESAAEAGLLSELWQSLKSDTRGHTEVGTSTEGSLFTLHSNAYSLGCSGVKMDSRLSAWCQTGLEMCQSL